MITVDTSSMCCAEPHKSAVVTVSEDNLRSPRAAQQDSRLEEQVHRMSLQRQGDAAEDRTHPLAKPKEYCFQSARAHSERLKEHHRGRHEDAQAELARLQVK